MKRALVILFCLTVSVLAQSEFFLKDGDRVVFYGDSITDQRLYTTFVETFVKTRFPQRNITFTHSGWGGDRVTGGGGGTSSVRVARDIAPYKPTVVTVMLGMNDGRYRPFDEEVFGIYSAGYKDLLGMIKAAAPGARITLIEPSPYDEVTRAPMAGGGYNPVLVKYGEFLKQLAAANGATTANLNGPVVAMLEKANTANAEIALRIIPDRVHPGASGHLVMAQALLKDWGAAPVVSEVTIDALAGKAIDAKQAQVSGVTGGEVVSWTELEAALPMPVDLADPVTALAVKSSDFMNQLNRQMLRVTGLKPGMYALRIDGQQVGVYPQSDFEAGMNLAGLPTPMLKQAGDVHALTMKRTNVHNARWRVVQTPLEKDGLAKKDAAMAALDAVDEELAAKQAATARPVARRFEVVPVPAIAANIPPGFTPIFDGKNLDGWHISKTNHHGQTTAWKVVAGGVLEGTQDKPGHGGIILTNKKFKNFEVYIEVDPDFGCDGGLFLRSSEAGEAYQVLLDYREGGEVGGVYGERLKDVKTYVPPDWKKYWKTGEWNAIRARIEGDIPHIQVWMNGTRITDWFDSANHLPGGATEGMIAVQVHGGNKIWKEGGYQRFRNIAVRELP